MDITWEKIEQAAKDNNQELLQQYHTELCQALEQKGYKLEKYFGGEVISITAPDGTEIENWDAMAEKFGPKHEDTELVGMLSEAARAMGI